MKKIIFILLVLITIMAFCACSSEPEAFYKGVNGENISNVGEYGAKRIIEGEAFEYKTQYVIAEIPCLVENTLLFVITFWCADEIYADEESAVAIYTYMYMWSNTVVDDTWNQEIIINEW